MLDEEFWFVFSVYVVFFFFFFPHVYVCEFTHGGACIWVQYMCMMFVET